LEKVWQSRHGWQAWAFLKAQSGMTATVTHATNFNGADQRTTARFFKTAYSRRPRSSRSARRRRTRFADRATIAVDLMVGKIFKLGERLQGDLRPEASNLTNTSPLGEPNGTSGSITTASDPRVFEFVARVKF
jgi:hypothetical protein